MDGVTTVFGQGYKADLAREGLQALDKNNGNAAKRVAEKLLSLSESAAPGFKRDQERKFALRMLAQSHTYLNDPAAAQKAISQLTEMTSKLEPGVMRTHEFCCNTLLLGYAQLSQGNIENVRIAAEQVIESAEGLPKELRDQMRSFGLTLQGYAYNSAEMGEIAEEAADEKLRMLETTFSDPKTRALSRQAALGLKVVAALEQNDTNKARRTIAYLQATDPESLYPQVLSGITDIAENKYESAYSTALRICNQMALKGEFDPEAMMLLRRSAHLLGHDGDYANYVADAKRNGLIRKEDTTYDPIIRQLSPEQEAQLQDELKNTVGQYARSRITKTTEIITPINGDAARVVGLNTRTSDERAAFNR